MYKNIKSIIICLLAVTSLSAQHFEGTFTNEGNKLTFKIKPVGGSITESITYIDFNFRFDPSLNITYANITPNTADFPGLNIQKFAERQFNGMKYQRFAHNTGTLGMKTYTQDVEYEVFTVTLNDIGNAMGDLELVMDLSSEANFPNDYIFSVNNSIGIPITDQTAPYSYFYASQTNPTGSEYVMALANVALPIELKSFEAIARQEDIMLEWEVLEEINLSNYEILRSESTDDFKAITSIEFNEKNNGRYAYVDSDVEANVNYYYILSAIDLDGSVDNSRIRQAMIKGSDIVDVEIFPNPVHDHFYIKSTAADMRDIQVFDLEGKVMTSQLSIVDQGDHTFYIDSSELSSGTYFVKIADVMKKIVVAK